ncbi:MAG: hypothetical protein R3E79_61210 [Caldilineaceae bacterium]
MSLETRVETLEHELKILKNEIESTLIEIQNQILLHYYPALRAEELEPPKDLFSSTEAARIEKRREGQGKENLRSRTEDEGSSIMPQTKEISFDEIRGKPKKAATLVQITAAPAAKATVTTATATVADQAILAPLAKWVNESVEQIGKARTQAMIESSANADYCRPEVSDMLLQLIELSEEAAPPEQVETKAVMNVLLKLNKTLDQVVKVTAPSSLMGK